MIKRFPQWVAQPTHLLLDEMNCPKDVISEYFEHHSLIGTRHCLDLWLLESLRQGTEDIAEQLELKEALVKLVEAAWVINQSKKKI